MLVSRTLIKLYKGDVKTEPINFKNSNSNLRLTNYAIAVALRFSVLVGYVLKSKEKAPIKG